MLHENKLRKKVLLGLLSSPVTLVPLLFGATLLAGALAFSKNAGMMLFGGLACVLGAAGMLLTRLLLGSEKRTQEAVEELRKEAAADQERRLDDLDRRLAVDQDSRTESTFRDLRAFEKAFRGGGAWMAKLNATSAFDIMTGVQELFEGCVKSLETSLELYHTARSLRTPAARKPILQRRDEIVRDVQKSTEQLSRILVGIQTLGAHEDSEAGLARIRTELDASMSVAKKVEEKMRSWQQQSAEFE